MPEVKKSRLGEAARGTSAASGADNFKVIYPVARRTKLTAVVVSGLSIGGPQLSGTGTLSYRVLVYVGGTGSNGANLTNTGAADATGVGEVICDHRCVSSSVCPVSIPLSYVVQAGETVTVEVTAGNDNGAGGAVALDVGVHLCGDDAPMSDQRV